MRVSVSAWIGMIAITISSAALAASPQSRPGTPISPQNRFERASPDNNGRGISDAYNTENQRLTYQDQVRQRHRQELADRLAVMVNEGRCDEAMAQARRARERGILANLETICRAQTAPAAPKS